jgi:peroxiredoxin
LKRKILGFLASYQELTSTKPKIKNFIKEYKLSIPIYMDSKTAFAKKLGASITPEVFVIGKVSRNLI